LIQKTTTYFWTRCDGCWWM